jgi:carboxymethylenebutenolidase
VQDIVGALRYLRGLPQTDGKGLGMIGFCMGGRLAWQTALATDLADASSSWYGRPPEPLEQLTASKTAFQGIFAGIDRIPVSLADDLKDLFSRHGMTGETHVYPEAKHGFLNDTRPEIYDEAAAKDAFERALTFFRSNGV